MRIHKAGRLALLILMMLAPSGCPTMTGRWFVSDLSPAMARDQFDLFRPACERGNLVSADIRLQKDGTFLADMKNGSELVQVAGTWALDGQELTLTDQKGRAQVFFAKSTNDQTLHLITGMKGTDMVLETSRRRAA